MKTASPSFTPTLISFSALKLAFRILLIFGAILVISALVWQGITANGSPDPETAPKSSPYVAILDIAILVFREGLECVLVLSALTAGLTGIQARNKQPIAWGAGIGFLASLITWFVAVGFVQDIGNNVNALSLQAGTGLVAILVLLIVMNWFFHKVYWGGWITMHNRQKKALIEDASENKLTPKIIYGLGLLGFFSLYREGFEIVLFLQGYRLKFGNETVLYGTLIGLLLSGIVAILNFIAHKKLPYRKMLIFTGIMLGAVLLVMVGEQGQEMQQAHWISTTSIAWLQPYTPDWLGLWFSIFPTWETLGLQGLAAALVIGSYYGARRQGAAKMAQTDEV